MSHCRGALLMLALALAWTGVADAANKRSSSSHHATRTLIKHPQHKSIKSPAAKSQHSEAQVADLDDDPGDEDFQRRAAELREWLRVRDEERERYGEASTEMPEHISGPATVSGRQRIRQQLEMARSKRLRNLPPGTQYSGGRVHHVLDPSRPIQLPGQKSGSKGTSKSLLSSPTSSKRKSSVTLKKAK